MSKSQLLDSLKGEKVTISCLDRNETTFHGEMLEASDVGVAVKTLNHGREFIEFIPFQNIGLISHKVLGK